MNFHVRISHYKVFVCVCVSVSICGSVSATWSASAFTFSVPEKPPHMSKKTSQFLKERENKPGRNDPSNAQSHPKDSNLSN